MAHIRNDSFLDKTRREAIDLAVVGEAIRILKNRHCFHKAAFRRYLRESGLLVVVPDEVTPEWLHRIALGIAGEFARHRSQPTIAKSKSNIAN